MAEIFCKVQSDGWKKYSHNIPLNGLHGLSALCMSQNNIQNWFCCRQSRTVQRSAHPYVFPWTWIPTWGLILALILCLGLAEFLQHSNIYILTAEYELCTISSEKKFNDASLVQSASTNEEWFPLSWLQGWRCWFDLILLVALGLQSMHRFRAQDWGWGYLTLSEYWSTLTSNVMILCQ